MTRVNPSHRLKIFHRTDQRTTVLCNYLFLRTKNDFSGLFRSNYLTYLEEARLQWLQHVPGWFNEHSMPVLAASEVNYRRPIEWPAQLNVALFCERLGNSSITLAHRIVDAGNGALYSDGKVVLVWMDPASGKPVPLPQSIRDAAETGM